MVCRDIEASRRRVGARSGDDRDAGRGVRVDHTVDQRRDGLAESVRRHPVEAGVRSDRAPTPLDVADLVPGAVACGEHRVVVIRSLLDAAPHQNVGGERRQRDGAFGSVRLRLLLPVGALSAERRYLSERSMEQLNKNTEEEVAKPELMTAS